MPSIPLSLVLPDFVSRLFVPLQLRGTQHHRASFKLAPDRTIDNAVCVCVQKQEEQGFDPPNIQTRQTTPELAQKSEE